MWPAFTERTAVVLKAKLENINECSFSNNSASWGGGVAYVKNSTLNTSESKFSNNHRAVEFSGGALVVYHSTVNIIKTDFSNNSAYAGCRFSNNRASLGNGGAMMMSTIKGSIVVRDSVFSNNRAGDKGGAITAHVNTMNITDCRFSNNRANFGGAVCINISKTVFNKNREIENVGAVYVGYGRLILF